MPKKVEIEKKIEASKIKETSAVKTKAVSDSIDVRKTRTFEPKTVSKKTEFVDHSNRNRSVLGANNRKNNSDSYKEKAAEIEKNILLSINSNSTEASPKYSKLVSVNKLMETGAHIGLSSKRWNPKMKPYIYAKKGNNHIIDLTKTVVLLNKAYQFLVEFSKNGGQALIVGTRGDIIKKHVKDESRRAASFYINERWLGGTLTNFKTINNSIKKFNNLLVMQKFGEIEKYNKKEKVQIKKETEKLAKFFGGIRLLKELPQVLILTDPENEKNALLEARKLSIPVIAICNSNATPEGIDYVIPANNYSIKTVYLLIGILADAICEGKGLPKNYVGKNDDEIVFPEIVKKRPEYIRVVNHRNNYTNR